MNVNRSTEMRIVHHNSSWHTTNLGRKYQRTTPLKCRDNQNAVYSWIKIMTRQLIRCGSHEGVYGNEETVITP
jgi:hypothetical protein